MAGHRLNARAIADDTARPRSSAVRDQIILAATELFAKHGYAQTTMTAIAEAANLRQPSIYYWFRNKEDLLQTTVSINRFSASVATSLVPIEMSPAAKLYRLLHEDTRHICQLNPLDYGQVESIAYQRPVEFAEFWNDYSALFDAIVTLIEAGVEDDSLQTAEARFDAATALGLNEGLQKLHQYSARGDEDNTPAVFTGTRQLSDAIAVAHQSASTTLKSLLREPRDLAKVRNEAMLIDLTLDAVEPDARPA